MVTILLSAVFRGAALIRGEALIRGRRLIEGGAYFNVDTQGGVAYYRAELIQARHLLEEIRYLTPFSSVSIVDFENQVNIS